MFVLFFVHSREACPCVSKDSSSCIFGISLGIWPNRLTDGFFWLTELVFKLFAQALGCYRFSLQVAELRCNCFLTTVFHFHFHFNSSLSLKISSHGGNQKSSPSPQEANRILMLLFQSIYYLLDSLSFSHFSSPRFYFLPFLKIILKMPIK